MQVFEKSGTAAGFVGDLSFDSFDTIIDEAQSWDLWHSPDARRLTEIGGNTMPGFAGNRQLRISENE